MKEVYLHGQRVTLNPKKILGAGGEADVYDIGNNLALKVFKQPTHPDFQGFPDEQTGARLRLKQHQQKLPAFPKDMPPRVVGPIDLAMNNKGDVIVGYTMKLLSGVEKLRRFGEPSFHQPARVPVIFVDLHKTVSALHQRSVILGDFNDLNVLVDADKHAHLIDADSFEYGGFRCAVFTARFVDPLLCDPTKATPELVQPYNPNADWYAYAVMLFQSLLRVDPFGGVYTPKDPKQRLPQSARPLKGITVFHPDVRYPKPAVPYRVLPDDLLHQFNGMFAERKRGVFPVHLVESMRWTKCTACGEEHARPVCPHCAYVAPDPATTQVTVVRGNVTCLRLFRTTGTIVFAAHQQGRLRWLYHERERLTRDGVYPDGANWRRESEELLMHGPLDHNMRFRLQGDVTWIGKADQLVSLTKGKVQSRLNADTFGTLPLFDATEQHVYWSDGGQLYRDGRHAPELLGSVLSGQTLFWCGKQFGFGFQRAGAWSNAFVFDAVRTHSLKDGVPVPRLVGQLVDSTCVFAGDRAWFFVATQEKGRTINRCVLIRQNGTVEAAAEAEEGDGSWLSRIRGKCAAGNFLLSATDNGVVRVDAGSSGLQVSRAFPDTEPFVHEECHLFADTNGLIVVDRHEVRILRLG